MPELLKFREPRINQEAIHLTAAEFAERVASGDQDIFHQRFTVRADDFEAPKSSEAVPGIEPNQQIVEFPQVGEVIIAKIDGRLTEATLVGFFLDANEKQVAIVEGLNGKSIRADLLAFTPEIQEHLRADFKAQEFGGDVLTSVKVNNPHTPEDVTEVNEGRTFLTREQRQAYRQVEQSEGLTMDKAETHPIDTSEEVAALNIEKQRAVRDYAMYMSSAAKSIRINGYNKDAENDRRRADDIIKFLPSAIQDLAEKYYKQQKDH